jgi:hypothetical protein
MAIGEVRGQGRIGLGAKCLGAVFETELADALGPDVERAGLSRAEADERAESRTRRRDVETEGGRAVEELRVEEWRDHDVVCPLSRPVDN